MSKVFTQGDALVHAVDGVDLAIDAGEFVVIEGPSGSGKSSLLQLLGGLDRPTAGEILFEDEDLATLGDGPLAELRLRAFGFVFQQFNLIPTLSAKENVEAALAPTGVSRREREERASELLDVVELGPRAKHLPSQLSGGEQQRVAIARALANDPRVILADEPTGNLDTNTGAGIIELLQALATELGKTVVVITHDPGIAAMAPRVVRLRDGRLQTMPAPTPLTPPGTAPEALPGGEVAPRPVVSVLGSARDSVTSYRWFPTDAVDDEREVILRAEGVRKTYATGAGAVDALRGINLAVHRGSLVAVTGPSGSGKTTLLNCLAGLDRIDSGRVLFDGKVIHDLPDDERSRQRASSMGFVFQTWNLIPVFSAVENVELPLLLSGMGPDEAQVTAEATLARMGLSARMRHRPAELSGGEQQRVAIARALAAGPKVVWADEPTGNLDSETAASVVALLRELNREGLTLVLVTHDEELATGATRWVRMRDGSIVDDTTRATEDTPLAPTAANGGRGTPAAVSPAVGAARWDPFR